MASVDIGFTEEILDRPEGRVRYRLYLPEGYKPAGEKCPVLLFLHGRGSRGADNLLQVSGNLGDAVRNHPARFPFIVVAPQCPADGAWVGPWLDSAIAVLRDVQDRFNADSTRTYVVGNSMGGYGLMYAGALHKGIFAGGLCISGGITPPSSEFDNLKAVAGKEVVAVLESDQRFNLLGHSFDRFPVWFFHGSEDDVVPIEESKQCAEGLKAAGLTVRYTEYKGQGHDISGLVYASDEVFEWLLEQKRS